MARKSKPINHAAVEAYKSGFSGTTVASQFGISPSLLYRWVRDSGGEVRTFGSPTDIDYALIKDSAVDAYKNGFSRREVGHLFGVDATTVSAWVKKSGVVVREPRPFNDPDYATLRESAVDAYESGLSSTIAGELFGVEGKTIIKWVKKSGGVVRRQQRTEEREDRSDPDYASLQEAAVDAYESGFTGNEVGELFGVTARAVYSWVRASGKSVRGPGPAQVIRVDAGDPDYVALQEAAVDAYESGLSSTIAGELFGVESNTIIRWVRKSGGVVRVGGNDGHTEHRPSSELTPKEESAIIDKRKAGTGIVDLVTEFNFPYYRVQAICREAGLGGKRATPKKSSAAQRDRYVMRTIKPDHPYYNMGKTRGASVNSRRVAEHRLVLAEHLGRALTQGEQVHHINGDRSDNRVENLQLRQGPHGSHQHWRCCECGSENVMAEELADA